MPKELADTTVARQVELAIGRLESLSTLPCVAAQFLDKLLQPQFSPSMAADIIESDPALALKILSLAAKRQMVEAGGKFSLRYAIDRLPVHEVRDAVLSVKVLQPAEFGDGCGGETVLRREELLLHSVAVACCAADIAQAVLTSADVQQAYCAGLLHDIGKLALEEAMPKSFARIVEEARSAKSSLCDVEQKHLGGDHTIFGKRLARKWALPEEIALAVWLHHSDVATVCEGMPEAKLAAVVQLADCMARQAGLGQSGSFDAPEPASGAVELLGMDGSRLEQIRLNLPQRVKEKSKILGLDLPNPLRRYCETIGDAAGRLAKENTELTLRSRQFQAASSHLDFITDFLLSVGANSTAVEIAENFAVRWQKFYQTGTVCLYLAPPVGEQMLQAVVVERLAQSEVVVADVPEGVTAVPQVLTGDFEIVDAEDHIDWLFEQLAAEFDAGCTKLASLSFGGKVVGVIAFELHWPVDAELLEEKLKTSASVAAAVLDAAVVWEKHRNFAERLVRLISKPKDSRSRIAPADGAVAALAEIAAGAAHELNNPLAVISGRAQLLAGAETDRQKKEILKQIQNSARDASAIIEDLMGFAEPPQPRRVAVSIGQVLEEAVELTRQKTGAEHINAQIKVGPDVGDIFVDSGQIVSAIANVITNAVESYSDRMGPVKIIAETSGNFVKLQVGDLGCGMDARTLARATHPFFSAKPAGRKRGMGLAYTARFIQLNEGLLNIESEPDKGTSVTIYLPRK